MIRLPRVSTLRIIGIVLLLLCSIGASAVIQFIYFIHSPLLTSTKTSHPPLIVELMPGMSMQQFAQQLAQQGVLTHPQYFTLYARFTHQAHHLQAGEYAIDDKATPADVLQQLTTGEVVQHRLTIVEGWTVAQLLEALLGDDNLIHTQSANELRQTIRAQLPTPRDSIEGLFYPDTYAFPKGTTADEFLQRAYQRLQQQLASVWQTRAADLPYQTPYHALIVASLIEKEARLSDERRLVASVILNRLHAHMPLQIDAAVLYGVNQHAASPKLALTHKDLRADTPYNTYVHRGLPPTPIALVSADALQAALHPAHSDYYYYVSKGDGSHVFSKTLKAHQQAVLTYQLSSKDRP